MTADPNKPAACCQRCGSVEPLYLGLYPKWLCLYCLTFKPKAADRG